jgi:hypothetical protein
MKKGLALAKTLLGSGIEKLYPVCYKKIPSQYEYHRCVGI